MTRKILTIILLGVLSGSASVGEARTLLSGTSGSINIPSAHVRFLGQGAVTWQHTSTAEVVAGNLVALPNLEVSFSHWSPDAGATFNQVSAKYQWQPETLVSPAFAVGVEDFTDQKQRSAYLVASKDLLWGLRFHVGVGTGRFDRGFVGVEKQFKVNSKRYNLGVMTEYDGVNFNYGLTVPVVKFVQAELGMRSDKFYAGVHGTF
ncbi:MAG: YjbH domain-containing protein [Acidaminococcaceae bacterium]